MLAEQSHDKRQVPGSSPGRRTVRVWRRGCALVFQTSLREFNSPYPLYAAEVLMVTSFLAKEESESSSLSGCSMWDEAQMVERLPVKREVVGSSPTIPPLLDHSPSEGL